MKIINSKMAFTLVEIMIAVAIIGVLSSIAVPNFVKSRDTARKNVCIANMMHIRDAEDMYALETNAQIGTTPLKSALSPPFIRTWPKCNSTEYAVPAIGSDAVCPIFPTIHTLSTPVPPRVPVPRIPFR